MISRSILILIGLVLPLDAVAQPPVLDATQGEIDGKVAVAFLAHELGDPSAYLPPEGFEVHLVPASDLDRELVYPAGQWFQPPPGRYRFWVEGNWSMSSGSAIVSYSGSPFRKRGLVGVEEMHPAGLIALDSTVEAGPEIALRLLHTESHNRGKFPQREISRRVVGEARREGVLMPAGPILAGLFDTEKDEYIALSRPVRAPHGEKVTVAPTPPAPGGSHVVVVLNRPTPVSSQDEYDVRLSLAIGEKKIKPSLTIPTADRLYGVWYQVEGRYAELTVESETVFLEPIEIPLRAGKVERVKSRLSPLPDLDVSLQLPDELRALGARLAVRPWDRSEALYSQEVEVGVEAVKFPRLQLGRYEVELQAGPWTFVEDADLTAGQSQEVEFSPEPILLSGTVYRGEDRHPGTVQFYAGAGRELEATTDERGGYEAIVFRPVLLVRVQLAGANGPPFAEIFDPPIRYSRTLDLRVPATDFRVQVIDAQTGQPVPEAEVAARNETLDGKTFQQSSTTDGDGVAALPPMRPGRLLVVAEAEGYLPMAEPSVEPVHKDDPGKEISVSLDPIGETTRLRLLLEDGRPAVGAEVLAVPDLRDPTYAWSGRSDSDGRVAVPRRAHGTYLLVRHQKAGFQARRWKSSEEPIQWTLPSARSLAVEVVDSSGERVPWAGLTLWVDGLRLEGAGLAWLTETRGSTDRHGVWLGKNLPMDAHSLLAWRPSAREEALTGRLDVLAVPIPRRTDEPLQVHAAE